MIRRSSLLLILLLSACGTTTVGLPYDPPSSAATPPAAPVAGVPVIGRVVATDARGESDPRWLGTIRGGFGNPLKSLQTDAPAAEEVAQGFRQALAARGMLSSGAGRYNLDITVVRFDCDQYHRREANADFRLVLTDRASGRPVYQDEVSSHLVNGSMVTFNVGVFADPQDLRAIAMDVQNQAIDQALNKPGFLAALSRG
jgi:hypothetical protein